jgi:hypothetical protein
MLTLETGNPLSRVERLGCRSLFNMLTWQLLSGSPPPAYMMFVALHRKYAMLKPIFEQPARGRLGKHLMLGFTMVTHKIVIKQKPERALPNKSN